MSGEAVRRYAKALYELAGERGCFDEVRAGMARVVEVVKNDAELVRKLRSVRTTREEKVRLAGDTLAAGSHPFVANVLRMLVERRREADLVRFLLAFFEHDAARRGVIDVRLESARSLEGERLGEIQGRLASATGKTVNLEPVVVPELIGGVRLTIGSRRIDASVKRQLDEIETRLKAAV